MTVRCRLRTSSYLRTFLRISKFCCSTWVCADLMARETILDSIGSSSGMLSRVMIASTAAAQLVVDPAGLVPLGAQHVQAAGLHDLVVLLLDLRLDVLEGGVPGGFVLLRRLRRGQATLPQLRVGDELGV